MNTYLEYTNYVYLTNEHNLCHTPIMYSLSHEYTSRMTPFFVVHTFINEYNLEYTNACIFKNEYNLEYTNYVYLKMNTI